ncbi:unnamed protein product, partial [Musa acuminata subsp. malaccensis]
GVGEQAGEDHPPHHPSPPLEAHRSARRRSEARLPRVPPSFRRLGLPVRAVPLRSRPDLRSAAASPPPPHPAHPSHPLTLHLSPAYSTGAFLCNACSQNGAAFCFHCARCQFDRHLPCDGLAEKLSRPSHPHPVTLVHQDPTSGRGYLCDLCRGAFDASSQWLYSCRACDFGGHISCFVSGTKPAEQATAAQRQIDPAAALSGMQQKLMAQMFMADTMAQTGRNAVALTGGPREYVYYNSAPLPSQYAGMADSMVMNNLALLSLNDQKTGGGGGGPAGGDVASSAGNTSTLS